MAKERKGKYLRCPNCNKDFYVRPSYSTGRMTRCSMACSIEFRKKKDKQCEMCKKVFTPHNRSQRFCSYACSKTGPLNPMWVGGTKKRDRHYKKDGKLWRQLVYERDGYKCVFCGNGGRLRAHHLNGFHWCIEQRNDVGNGVTLCDKCHTKYHKVCGHKFNTKEQFKEYAAASFQGVAQESGVQ